MSQISEQNIANDVAAVLDAIGRCKQPGSNYQEAHLNSCVISPVDNGYVNIDIAKDFAKISEATLRDVSSMNTIAIMTWMFRVAAFGSSKAVCLWMSCFCKRTVLCA